jgi:hypothetical protein
LIISIEVEIALAHCVMDLVDQCDLKNGLVLSPLDSVKVNKAYLDYQMEHFSRMQLQQIPLVGWGKRT